MQSCVQLVLTHQCYWMLQENFSPVV